MTLLSHTTDLFFTKNVRDISAKSKIIEDNLITEFHSCSDEYLFKAFELKLTDFGFPRALKGTNLGEMQRMSPNDSVVAKIPNIMSRIGRFLGTPNQALSMYYPDDGYIGWHHNGNASGYNILMTYSQDGNGGFSFWDYGTKSIKTIPDKKGWSVKVGYYPNEKKEPNRVYWHMAKTTKARVTIAWVLNQKEMWKNMIDEISQGDYDHDDVLEQ